MRPAWLLPTIIGGGVAGLAGLVAVLVILLGGGDDSENAPSNDETGKVVNAGDHSKTSGPAKRTVKEYFPPKPVNTTTRPAPATATVDPTGFPAAAKAIVVIRNDRFPGNPACGVYFRKAAGRCFVASPIGAAAPDGSFRGRSFTIEFFPGQPDQRSLPARALGVVDGHLFLEVRAKLPDPPVSLRSDTKPQTRQKVRVFGFDLTAPPGDGPGQLKLVDYKSEWGRRSVDNIPTSLLGGGLVCDDAGAPIAICDRARPQARASQQRRCVLFERLAKATQPYTSGGLEDYGKTDHFLVKGVKSREGGWRANLYLRDVLQLNQRVEFYLGTLDRIRRDAGSLNRKTFDSPAADGMQQISLQPYPVPRSTAEQQLYGVALRPKEYDPKATHLVLQVKLVSHDGTARFEPPYVIPAGRLHDRKLLTDELYERMRDKRMPETPKLKFVIDGRPEPEPSNRNLSDRPYEDGETRIIPWALSMNNDRKYAGTVLKDYVGSPDGLHVYLVSSFGRVQMIRTAEDREVRAINLFQFCADVDLSAEGLVVLGGQMLWILNPATLEVRRTIDVPFARRFAASAKSSLAIAVVRDELVRVDLKKGTVSRLRVVGTDGKPVHFARVIGIERENDGRHVLIADEARLYRLRIRNDDSITVIDRSRDIGPLVEFIYATGGDRVAAVSRRPQIRLPGFPKGGGLVFKTENLKTPVAGLRTSGKGSKLAMNPVTGGFLLAASGPLQWVRDDGREMGLLKRVRGFAYGVASPDGNSMMFAGSIGVGRMQIEKRFASRDSLRAPKPVKPQPEELNRRLLGKMQSLDGWKWATLPLSAEAAMFDSRAAYRGVVDSIAWSDDGKTGYLLMADGTLNRIRFPGLILDRRLQLRPSHSLIRTSEGLLVTLKRWQEVVLIDEQTLSVKERIPVAGVSEFVGSPKSSRIWRITTFEPANRLGIRPQPAVVSFDLKTREFGRPHTVSDVKEMMTQAAGGEKRPVQLRGLSHLAVSPDNRYLFLSDRNTLARFGIHNDVLAFQDRATRFAPRGLGPIVISHDSTLVAAIGGNRKSRETHPSVSDGRNYGSYVFAIDDFDRVAIHAATPRPGNTLAFNVAGRQAYSTSREAPLLVIDADASIRKALKLPLQERRIRLSSPPAVEGVLILGQRVHWTQPEAE